MSEEDPRPPVWVGRVVLETDRLEESARFMRSIGMRPVYPRPEVAVFELRGGTHLILIAKSEIVPAGRSVRPDGRRSPRNSSALHLPGPQPYANRGQVIDQS